MRRAAVIIAVLLGTTAALADDAPMERRSGGLIRAALEYPGQVSFTFGTIVTSMPADYDCTTVCPYRGATVQGTVGWGAGKLAIGYGSLVGETGAAKWLLKRVYLGYGLRMALLRTWGSSNLDPHGVTFWGGEAAFTITQFSITAGAYRPVDPGADPRSWRLFGGVGWGF
ncbi:MAG TPA: hypothetical protein VFV19_05780 [Candidatus Polarisedimenticolaceae bacterium]|nr:hypothetical protein [Candidatus Polarisedimenticolaceae bacterium]